MLQWLQKTSFVMLTGLYAPLSSARENGLVNCSGPDCNFCSFGVMLNSGINWLFGFMAVFAVVVLAVAGFKLVVSAGNVEERDWAKARIGYVILGFLLMLSSWLIIDTILRGVTGSEKGMQVWGSFDIENCGGQFQTKRATYEEYVPEVAPGGLFALEGPEAINLSGAAYTGDHACQNCVDMSTFITCKRGASCSTDREYAERLAGLANVSGVTLEVTEAYPPTRTHKAQCHSNGTCVDIVFQDRNWTAERVQAFQNQAQALGFRAVYEPGPGQSCLGSSNCVTGVATGNHFSLYAR